MAPPRPRFRIGIDTGGTFTGVVAVNEATREVLATKTPSTPDDPSLGVLEGLRKVLRLAGGGAVAAVSHGTTVATNALLQERFEGGGLGYLKEIRVLRDSFFLSVADRSILSCWSVAGGKAGAPFRVTVDPGGPSERVLTGLVDDEPLPAGTPAR